MPACHEIDYLGRLYLHTTRDRAEGVETVITTCLDLGAPLVDAVADKLQRKTPLKSFRLFAYGDVPTTKGSLLFDEQGAIRVMAFYEAYTSAREGWLDIDVAHLSQGDDPDPQAHKSAGKFRLDLREDGLWAKDVTYVPEFFEAVAEERFRSYSPVVEYDEDRRICAVLQLALTNIPAMHGATPLALSVRGALPPRRVFMSRFNPIVMTALCLAASTEVAKVFLETDKGAMEDKPAMDALFRALSEAAYAAAPGCHLEEVYEDHVVVGCPREMGGAIGEKYMRMPYTVEGGKVKMGAGIAVVKKFIPAEGAESADVEGREEEKMKVEMSASLARASEIERQLLAATGARSVSAAIAQIEQLRQHGGPEVTKRLEALERESFSARRTVLLDGAKRAGKWTAGLEKQADRTADRARKLGEDPIAAMQELFDHAPVVVAPGQERQLQALSAAGSADGLTAEEQAICEEQAKRLGVEVKTYTAQFLTNRKRFGHGARA